jgi:Protein of unknown function (DUF2971)
MNTVLADTIDVAKHPVFKEQSVNEEYVYHYTTWERLLDIMHAGFRLSPLATMNDPRESKEWLLHLMIQTDFLPEDRGRRRIPDETIAAAQATVNDYRSKVRVGAFCIDHSLENREDGVFRGYGHPRMWAQYADNHKGVCIVLNKAGLDRAIRERYPMSGDSWVRSGRVRYVESMWDDPAFLSIELSSVVQARENVRDHLVNNADTLFFTKHTDWRDENEYRWVYYGAGGLETGEVGFQSPFVNIKNHVAALVLGADYNNAHLPVARLFSRTHNLNGAVVRCVWRGLYLFFETFADDGNSLLLREG